MPLPYNLDYAQCTGCIRKVKITVNAQRFGDQELQLVVRKVCRNRSATVRKLRCRCLLHVTILCNAGQDPHLAYTPPILRETYFITTTPYTPKIYECSTRSSADSGYNLAPC